MYMVRDGRRIQRYACAHAAATTHHVSLSLLLPTCVCTSLLAYTQALIKTELFGSIKQETHEETNVPLTSLSEPLLIGAMCDQQHKPDLLFLTRTSLDVAGVRAAFARGAKEGWESDRLAFWPAHRLSECEEELPLTSVTRAAVRCFGFLDKSASRGVAVHI